MASQAVTRKYVSRQSVDRQMPRLVRPWGLFFAIGMLSATLGLPLSSSSALACPFCSAPQLTLAEQIAQTDIAVLVEWQSGVQPDFAAGTAGTTTFRIEKVLKSPQAAGLEPGKEITIPDYTPGLEGEFALIVGTVQETISWLSPLDISKPGFEYVENAPGPENAPALRLKYFVKYLESADPLVADDAYAEFANAAYSSIAEVKDSFPVDKLRKWVFDPETPVTRLGLYGLMLGLSGNESDIPALREKVAANEEDFRLGIDGVMAGYLLLSGAEGLTVLEKTKFEPALETPSPVPFSETFAAMQALKFLWEYAPETVDKERLRASMRTLLAHPDLADLVIIDLARWEDWSLLPKLKEIYGQEPYDVPAIKRSIVGYLIAAEKQKPEDESQPTPPFVQEAGEYLTQLEEQDPKTVKTARLLFR